MLRETLTLKQSLNKHKEYYKNQSNIENNPYF